MGGVGATVSGTDRRARRSAPLSEVREAPRVAETEREVDALLLLVELPLPPAVLLVVTEARLEVVG